MHTVYHIHDCTCRFWESVLVFTVCLDSRPLLPTPLLSLWPTTSALTRRISSEAPSYNTTYIFLYHVIRTEIRWPTCDLENEVGWMCLSSIGFSWTSAEFKVQGLWVNDDLLYLTATDWACCTAAEDLSPVHSSKWNENGRSRIQCTCQ